MRWAGEPSAELLSFDADMLMQELQVRVCISSGVY